MLNLGDSDPEMVESRLDLVEKLKRTPAGLDSVLKAVVPAGIAFHHAYFKV